MKEDAVRALLYDQLRDQGENALDALHAEQRDAGKNVRGDFVERRRKEARMKERHGGPSHISAAIADLEAAGWFPWSPPRV